MQSLGIGQGVAVAAQIEPAPQLELVKKTYAVPQFRQLPKRVPDRGLVYSCVLHFSALALLPVLSPPVQLVAQSHQVMPVLPLIAPDPISLPTMGDAGSLAGSSSGVGKQGRKPHRVADAAPAAHVAKFAGPQQIISDPPDATNELQTIRRLDLEKPMKIKAPIRLKSQVQLPSPPKIKLKIKPPEWLAKDLPTATPVKAEVTSAAPAPEKEPVLVVRKSEAKPKLQEAAAAQPKVVPDAKQAPNLSTPAGDAPTLAKAVVVINAVEPAPDPTVNIPNGEISGRFSVAPLGVDVKAPTASGSKEGGTGKGSGAKTGEQVGGSGTENGKGGTFIAGGGPGAGDTALDRGTGLVGSGGGSTPGGGTFGDRGTGKTGGGAGEHGGNGARGNGGVGNGNGAMRGISISGGSNGGGGGASGGVHITTGHPSYGMTIIAAGSNGGATRDLGVFRPGETVFTVHIPMRDAGGGPEWSLQYSVPDNKGEALTPPYAKTKVHASGSGGYDPNPVFVAAEIDADGNLGMLHAARASDQRSAAAIALLAKWQFSPAELAGKPVRCKILVGVQLMNSPAAATK